jgi:general secretion pathway protein D
MRAGRYEEAIQGLRAGLARYPESATLRAGIVEARSEAVARAIADAAAARNEGRLDDAEKILRRAQTLQPENTRIESLLSGIDVERRQRAALAEANDLFAKRKLAAASSTIAEALKSNPRHPELLALQRRIELEQRQAQVKRSQIGLAETRPISLDFRDANLRTVLDVVSRNSGINFILDKDIRADTRITIFLRSARVEDAINLITSTYQLSKKVIDSQTLLIYPNTPEKQREHQEQIVKVFYLSNGDAKGAAAFLKSMLKIREPFVDERSNMLSLRESQENIQLAERLVSLYDTSDPEVLLEVEVIEINTTRLTELGINFPNTFSLTLLPPSGDTGLNLANIRGITRDRIGLTVGGVTVNLNRTTGDYNTLASPRIRVKSKDKARVLVGDKIPLITSTTGTGGFVSDSVSYLEVGLKLEVEPTVYMDDDVSIKLGLEVSSLGNVVKTASGTQAYQIGTRNANTTLRLRDGETQLLAGLISTQDRNDASRVPGLGDLPVAGRLFSSQRDDNQRTELVLSITPHIIRNVRRPDVNEGELWVGTEAAPRMRPVGGVSIPPETSSDQRTPTNAGATSPGAGPASQDGSPAKPRVEDPVGPTVLWAGPAQAKVGETFTVSLRLKTTQPLRGVPLRFGFGKDKLELVDIDEGDLFKQGGAATSFTKTIDAAQGQATTGVLRNQANGATGEGNVVSLKFKALAAGASDITILSLDPIGLAGPVPKPAALPVLRVQVQ